jgi:hypothetical protein
MEAAENLTHEEIEKVRHTLAWMEEGGTKYCDRAEVTFLCGLVIRASRTQAHHERTIKLLRALLRECL